MNKQEFLKNLRVSLSNLPQEEIEERIIFYSEMIDDRIEEGLSEEEAKAMIVRGFASPISKELPVEYAAEMNNLINLELEGAIG